MGSNIEKISTKDLLAKNKPNLDGNAKDFASSTFWYYTNLDTASKILDKNSFWVSNLSLMNDESEKELHSSHSEKVHALCFCNSKTEKIPMWYLYAGITGKGVSIGLTPRVMKDFINSIDCLGVVDSDRILEKNKDFELQYGWVFYRKSDNVFKFKGKFYSISKSESEINNFVEGNFFIKDYPWEYEKEFRIVFINKTDISQNRLKIKFTDAILSKLKIRLGPEMVKEDSYKEIFKLRGFEKYFVSKLISSNLNIKMDLLRRNRKNIVIESPRILEEYKDSLEINSSDFQELREVAWKLAKILESIK